MNKVKELFKKYATISEAVKASIWFTVCNVIQKGIALLTTPIFTRIMTAEQYGQYTVYQSWYTIVAIFATLNLSAGVYNNGMIKWPEEKRKFTSSIQSLSTFVTIGLFLLYLVGLPFWNKMLDMNPIFMFAMFAELLFVPAFNFWAAGQRFEYKYKTLVVVTVLMAIASPLIGVISVLLTEYKAEARVLSFVFVQVCIGLVFYIYNISKGKTFFDKKYWSFALSFNLPLIPHYLSQTVLGQADRIMISSMVGSGEAALYGVAYSVSMMFNIVTNAINNSFIPYTYKSMRDKKYVELKKNSSFLVGMIAAVCVLVSAFAPEVIKIIAAPEYYDAHRAIPPIAISLLFIFISSLFGNIEFYFEETKFIMAASSVAAITNIVLNYYAIPTFGYIAAAYTTLVCYSLLAVAHYMACRTIVRRRINEGNTDLPKSLYDNKLIFVVSVVSVIAMLGMTLIYDYVVIRYTIILAILVLAFLNRKLIVRKIKELRK